MSCFCKKIFISNRLEFKQHIDKAGEGKEKVQAQLDEIHDLMREISGKLRHL